MTGIVIAAPASGSGKTTITLGLLRAMAQDGLNVRGAKSGPDYIDPRFHAVASGQPCVNLDAWAMTPDRIRSLAAGDGPLIVEGAMGLFDGAPPDDRGSSADLARALGLSVVLVVDAARMAGSIAPLVAGFAGFASGVTVAGVILNKVGSPRHEGILRRALAVTGIPVLGAVPRDALIVQPSRHLGLVQADEREDLDAFLESAAALVRRHVDIDALRKLMRPVATGTHAGLTPPAQRIALAQDRAFAFSYPHMIEDWRRNGAEFIPFSPLNGDPIPEADLVYLPGGYPELYAGQIVGSGFIQNLRNAALTTDIYGECGGYMVMGDGFIDADGTRHEMAGLLRLETSFVQRKLHLGYRTVTGTQGPFAGHWAAHEFHYATTIKAEGDALFTAQDAEGNNLPAMGLRLSRAYGSFAHVIDAMC